MDQPLTIPSQFPQFRARTESAIKGTSVMAEEIRSHAWGESPLGPIENWSNDRIAVLNLVLSSPFPSALLLGPDLFMAYNDAFRSLLDRLDSSGSSNRKPSAALGRQCCDGWAEAWPDLSDQLLAVLRTGETTLLENVVVPRYTASSTVESYLTYSFSPFYEAGEIAGVYLALRDTTEAVLSARRLRESEARSSRILLSIGDAVIVTDAESRVSRMNQVAESLTGWKTEQAAGRPLSEVFQIMDEDTRQPGRSPADEVKRSGNTVGLANHTLLVSRDKVETHIDDSAAPILDDNGKLGGIVLVFRDINEKRAAEKERERIALELDRRYNEMRAIYETSNVALAMIDPVDFKYLRGNPRLAEILNVPLEQIVGMPVFDLASDVLGLREGLAEASAGTPVLGKVIEGELANSPGLHRYWQVEYVPVFSAEGKVEVIVATSVEITHIKQMETALIQSEKLAVVGRLSALIAHEINNPLEAVMNLLYLSQSSDDLADIRQFLTTAEHELRRVSAITTQSLRFHKQSSHPTLVTCDELIDGVLAIYRSRLMSSQIRVDKRKRSARPVRCFEGEIRQVLNNLIGNAIDAMTPKGGRLIIRSRESTNWRLDRKGLVITVADTDGGIPPTMLQRIFEPFFTTKGMLGTGLGLWVSHGIVERHNGSLRVRSSQKQGSSGTVFALFLPFDAVNR